MAKQNFSHFIKIIFLGGSIIKHGGQNPLEPARYGCSIIHGPNTWNFREIYQLLNKYEVSYKVNNAKQITDTINSMFKNNKNDKNIKKKINDLGNRILDLTLTEVTEVKNEINKTKILGL